MEETKEHSILEEIASYLQTKNFVQEELKLFKLQRTLVQPGATMVINGQQVQQSGQELIHTVRVEFFGSGIVEEGTDHEERFEIIRFGVEDLMAGGKSGQEFEHMEGFYPGELNRFIEMLGRFSV